MRAPSVLGPVTAGLSTVLPLLSTVKPAVADGLSFHSVSYPELDLSPLGRVALSGDFDAVSLYAYTEQSNSTSSNNGSQSISTSLPNGVLTTLADSDGYILEMCPLTQKDGTSDIFVAGNFTSLGGVKAQGIAKFDPNTTKVTAMPGLSGSISAMLCDQDSNSIYVGGDFRFQNSSNAAAYVNGEGWKSLAFGGFNGPVTAILRSDDGNIIFGGDFDGIGNSTNSKKNQQVINLQDAKITSDAVSQQSGFSDPKNIICQTSGDDASGKTWLLYDNSPGYWRAEMGYGFTPNKIRLYNTHYDGRGTKDFLLRALPDNGIMNLTYTDDNGDAAHCDSSCPLSSSTDDKYREFHFVNNVGMSGFQIEVLDWYGDGAGLNGIEVFQENIMAYAVNDFNEPSCGGIEYPSKATTTGSWTAKPSGESQSGYLSTQVSDSTSSDASVVFEPDVKQSGNYSVLLYTPGCKQDDDCGARGMVNVTAKMSSSSDEDEPSPTTLYQTNYYEKYDNIFTGHVDASSSSFRPSVTLTPADGQNDITVVASRVRFVLRDASSGLSGELNGLYEYDPSTNTTETDFSKSGFSKAGLDFDDEVTIRTLIKQGDTIYAGGNFSDSDISNIMYFDDGNATALAQGGLNSEVRSIAALDNSLYVGGNFTGTAKGSKNLKHIASYSLDSNSWSALGGGVNGPVYSVLAAPLNVSTEINETTIAISGEFDKLLAFDDNKEISVAGFGIWIPSRKNWLQNLNVSQIELGGQLSAFTKVDNATLYAGSLASGGIAAVDAVNLRYQDGLHLDPLLSAKQIVNSTGGTYIGIYDTNSNRNLTVLGGQFSVHSTDGSTINNLILLDGSKETVTTIDEGVDSNSTFLSLAVADDTLYAGGNVTGSVGKANVELNGILAWDLSKEQWANMQPPVLNGENVVVNAIAPRPNSNSVYFGGNFEGGGGYPCPSVCVFDPSLGRYDRPGSDLSGTVLELKWATENKLIAAGNLQVDGNQTNVATYNAKKNEWTALGGASSPAIPGEITAFTPASQDISIFWVAGQASNGSSFITRYDGSSFQTREDLFGDGTTIRGLEVLPLATDHDEIDVLHKDQVLLVTGQLVVPDFGNASAVLYNGTDITPFILTSSADGQPGSMSRMFYENKNPYAREEKGHTNGIVVLVSFCCALGCIFLIVIAGIILNKIQRRRQGYMRAPQAAGTDRQPNMQRLPPEYLFNTLGQRSPAPAI
ncbi:putative cellular morphogenesis protein (Rax2) [Aspergillus glaucus CBS 516.65]|uniref:Uncharacterized protein n=1 Tax=Aspergillus glaucus CBS 516.65 TaxID=1160497 RepID=A0A1L9V9Y6_ASPGL|nr:hypothetical protein ASPGLDRAFT_178340 [Aspergillus glaucus CBS 516.65]OJJ80710.1 hypothetical protein ASPGLDRAFT_178340 [Aspergillus glaucus CBS 516.65]